MSSDVRSWSQLSQYTRCPLSYRLARIDKVWERPDAWRPMGTAVHHAIEQYEKSERTLSVEEVLAEYRKVYRAEINAFLEVTPNAEYFHRSGPYNGLADIPRRWGVGEQHVLRYLSWAEKNTPAIWTTSDGAWALELPFNVDIGGVAVRGFIDQVVAEEGVLTPVDIKTGSSASDPMQLAVYRAALRQMVDGEVVSDYGRFLMTAPKAGVREKEHYIVELETQLPDMFSAMDNGVEAGNFPAITGDHCNRCGVLSSCPVGQAFLRG